MTNSKYISQEVFYCGTRDELVLKEERRKRSLFGLTIASISFIQTIWMPSIQKSMRVLVF